MSACGGPKYVVKNRYIPPIVVKDNSCLHICEEKFESCQKACENQYQSCMADVRLKAINIYEKDIAKYEKQLAVYQEEMRFFRQKITEYQENFKKLNDDFRFFKRICQEKQDRYACLRQKELKKEIYHFKQNKPFRPIRPKKPNLEIIIKKLMITCHRDCGCQEIYDRCFLSCGGTIIPEKICVENCQ